jgi:four helix bundle protein
MESQTKKIRSFTDLRAWKEAHKLKIAVYKITATFPKFETYSLTDQMRRAGSSVTANIAEGFGRFGYKERVRFFYISQGSLTELKDHLLTARDIGYIDVADFMILAKMANEAHKLLQGLISKTKTFVDRIS